MHRFQNIQEEIDTWHVTPALSTTGASNLDRVAANFTLTSGIVIWDCLLARLHRPVIEWDRVTRGLTT